MNVEFINRWQAKTLLKEGNCAFYFISINDTVNEINEIKLLLPEHISNTAYKICCFKDDERSFTVREAKQLVSQIENWMSNPEYDRIVVHCFMGVSRSAAIAKYINDHYGLGIPLYDSYNQYNRHVYNTLLEESGVVTMRKYYKKFDKNG